MKENHPKEQWLQTTMNNPFILSSFQMDMYCTELHCPSSKLRDLRCYFCPRGSDIKSSVTVEQNSKTRVHDLFIKLQ